MYLKGVRFWWCGFGKKILGIGIKKIFVDGFSFCVVLDFSIFVFL